MANTFTGGLKVKGGSVVLSNNTAAGTGSISFDTGGVTNVAVQFSEAVTSIATGTTLTVDNSSSNNSGIDPGSGLITGDGAIIATGTSTSNIVLSGALGITKQGAGTLALNGVNTYSGDTTVNEGILHSDGSFSTIHTSEGDSELNFAF